MHPYLTPFHPLKVTKFLVKISQFNFFDSLLWQRKTFLLINLFRCEIFQILLYFLCKTYSPRWKRSPFYFPATPSKNRGPVKPPPPPLPSPFFENLVGGLIRRLPSPQQEGSAGAHYEKRFFYWVRKLLKDK